LIPNVLSIAGSDPSGGAGLQADLKTFAALGCYGMAAVTALTAQNTQGVSQVHLPPAAFVAKQIRMVFADVEVAAVKIGMLGSREIVEAVADVLAAHPRTPVVLDPVLVATSGATLGDDAVIEAMRTTLFPRAILVTPNLEEAARLAGTEALTTRSAIEAAALALRGDGSAAWLIKGGHGTGASADDLLLDDAGATWLSAPRVETRNTTAPAAPSPRRSPQSLRKAATCARQSPPPRPTWWKPLSVPTASGSGMAQGRLIILHAGADPATMSVKAAHDSWPCTP